MRQEGYFMRKYLVCAALAAVIASPAIAADMPVKAPLQSFSYPAASGWYGFVGTEGGGGSANVSAPGVNANSLVTNSIDINAGIGYVWGVAGTKMFHGPEVSVGYTDFNGAQQGLSFSGPFVIGTRWLIGAPVDQILQFIPLLGSQLATPTPPALPQGTTITGSYFYIAPTLKVRDESLAFGAVANKVWGVIPGLSPVGALWKLSNGGVLDTYTQIDFLDRSNCFGSGIPAGGVVCGKTTQFYGAGIKYKFGL
jgi:hypothetical protein